MTFHVHFSIDNQKTFADPALNELPVNGGNDPAFIKINEKLNAKANHTIASGDCHSNNHQSLAGANGANNKPFDTIMLDDGPSTVWTPHGRAGSEGAKLTISDKHIDDMIGKGMKDSQEQYSPDPKLVVDALLAARAKSDDPHGKISITVSGLAENYCVKNTAIEVAKELRHRGHEPEVTIVTDATRGVYLKEGEREAFVAEMASLKDAKGKPLVKLADSTSPELQELMSRSDRPPIEKPVNILGDPKQYEYVLRTNKCLDSSKNNKDLAAIVAKSFSPDSERGAHFQVAKAMEKTIARFERKSAEAVAATKPAPSKEAVAMLRAKLEGQTSSTTPSVMRSKSHTAATPQKSAAR